VPKQLLTVLYPGFAEWEVVFPLFCIHPAVEAQYVALGDGPVQGAMGFAIKAERTLTDVDAETCDGVYLPGGSDPRTKRFPRDLATHEGLLDLLRAFDRRRKVVAAICGAPLVLGAAGLLDGKKFACDVTEDTHGWLDRGHRVDETWAIDGRILTGSLRSLIPFSAALARLLGEEQTAREIREFLDLEVGEEK
jgi:4-methyl-5(b-hydroxyethyl)-thiazole monophosphate biosynthesis